MAIKALLFDYDGVLWDSEVAALRSWQETYDEHGQSLPLDYFATRLGTVGAWTSSRNWNGSWEPASTVRPSSGCADSGRWN